MNVAKVLYSFLFFLIAATAFGQTRQQTPAKPQQQQPQQSSDRIELVQADSLEGGTFNGVEIRKLLGNVIFKQKETFLHCDSAYQYVDKNALEAFGNVRINQADTLTITGQRASYDGDKRTTRMTGNVVMQDPKMTLTTPELDYDLNKKQASYAKGGVIVDQENRLESRYGNYDTRTRMFTFRQNVQVNTSEYVITSDNLKYNTQTKVVYFQGPTNIRGPRGNLYAEEGTYNTITKVSNFGRNASIETQDYILSGEKLFYDENTQYGRAQVNVRMVSKKNNIIIKGQEGKYWQQRGRAIVYGSPVMQSIVSGDTLFMSADTLLSVESKVDTIPGKLYAYHDVKIFRSDLQGKCDSLTYNLRDSLIHFHRNPVLWSNKSQITADSIWITLRNQTIDKMYTKNNAFIISEDTLHNFNQVKGRDMTATFVEGKINRVDVNGNGESVYFALEGDTAVTGMNKAICSDMIIKFNENKVKSISFLVKPDAQFIPPHELQEPDKKLSGFTWLIEEQPDLAAVLAPRKPKPEVKPAPAAAKPARAVTPPRKVKKNRKKK